LLLVGAILLALFVVDGPLAVALIVVAALIEISQNVFWFWYSKRKRPLVGPEALLGATAQVVGECRPRGTVRLQGELWQARCRAGAAPGERVRVVALNGLTLDVEPAA
jgi:membrane-bound serine protease (ClpP class)